MLNYFHGGQHAHVHFLNSLRLGADELKYLDDPYDNITSLVADGVPSLLMTDWLLNDNQVKRIIQESTADVDVFVTSEPVARNPVHKLCELLPFSLGVAVNRVLGLHLNGHRPGDTSALRANDVQVRIHQVSDPAICLPDFEVRRHVLTTKAGTLRFFEGLLTDARVDPGVLVTRTEWEAERNTNFEQLLSHQSKTLIVRSSAVAEDNFESSNAGVYTSVMNVDGANGDSVEQAIEKVFRSYGEGSPLDQVLIQTQILDSIVSGVCSSRVIGRNSPYFVVNYDDSSGLTDTVTAGCTNHIKTLYVRRLASVDEIRVPDILLRLMAVVREIEHCACHAALDVEFIVDRSEIIHIVQVRPLVGSYSDEDDDAIEERIKASELLFRQRQQAIDGVLQGSKVIFGVMPDANPAELIGLKPKPLAFSLYQRLITDDVVTNQRREFGYRDVRPIRHMIKLGGSPFIDVRSSLNSFTPSTLRPELASKLVDSYMSRLEDTPSLHDKVEFEVAVTTWSPGLMTWLKDRYGHETAHHELVEVCEAAKRIFTTAIDRVEGDFDEIEAYANLFDAVMCSSYDALNKAWRLIEVCHHYGCKPFAHLARSAFVAVSVLKGFVRSGALAQDEYDAYLHSIESVSSAMERDASSVRAGQMDRYDFYARYGHLRPGTYDILSPAYFEDPGRFLDPVIASARWVDKSHWKLSVGTIEAIETVFRQEGIDLTFSAFDRFARRAIHGREHGKFVYTRYLSHALNQLLLWGAEVGLTRDNLAYLQVRDIDDMVAGSQAASSGALQALLEERRRVYELDCRIELPDLICNPEDFAFFHKLPGLPNFITSNLVTAPSLVVLASSDPSALDLVGKIALIESADPGFDWLFGHPIAGLVTRYGGANSHMAIRCAEQGVPAAIGVGELLFGKLSVAPQLLLDCIGKRVAPILAA